MTNIFFQAGIINQNAFGVLLEKTIKKCKIDRTMVYILSFMKKTKICNK